MEASHQSKIAPYMSSILPFFAGMESQFYVNHQNIIGISNISKSLKVACKQDNQNRDYSFSTKLFIHSPNSTLVVLYEKINYFLVSKEKSTFVQYDFCSGKIIKIYKNIDLYRSLSYSRIGPILFVGGTKGTVKVILLDRKKVIEEVLKTAIGPILALKLCIVQNKGNKKLRRVFLVSSGFFSNYEGNNTDIFDVTEFLLSMGVPVLDGDFEVDEVGNLDW